MTQYQLIDGGEWGLAGREFSLLPFWFWNDELSNDEIVRQIDDFERHGVYGFVVHPRVGLPRSCGWMSDDLLGYIRFAVEQASLRGMSVVLYDEGMYPSGSSSGQVVAENPEFQVRCLDVKPIVKGTDSPLAPGERLVAISTLTTGEQVCIFDRKLNGVIRGLHYIDESAATEDEPLAADLLNPEAMACFRRLVYDRYASAVGDYFGSTVIGIFTDEPSLVGRSGEVGIQPGTTNILDHVNRILGYDFTPHLAGLWYDSEPDALRCRADYKRAVLRRLDETYYATLSTWCSEHGIALMGHPAEPDDYGLERYLQIPGQDLVWRHVVPGDASALEGPQSTQAKCSSSAMIHAGRRRNSNECCGAYGHSLTYDETVWLANWCFVRGVNMLIPHAFYYSVRGPRLDERPPDVGPHSAWWANYSEFADYCRRLSWLNTDCTHFCKVAIFGQSDLLPWAAAKICYQNQIDFNYLDFKDISEGSAVTQDGLHIAGMHYEVLILDESCMPGADVLLATEILARSGRRIVWRSGALPEAQSERETEFASAVKSIIGPGLFIEPPAPALRARCAGKAEQIYWMLFNEGEFPIEGILTLPGPGNSYEFLDPITGNVTATLNSPFTLQPHELKVLRAL